MATTRLVNIRNQRLPAVVAAVPGKQVATGKPGRIESAAARFVSVAQLRAVVKSVSLALARNGSLAHALSLPFSRGDLPQPQSWPASVSWRPIRYFGPFRGEGFDSIQVQIHGGSASGVGWYFNDYFTSLADAAEYRPFFGNNLPTIPTPDQSPAPGSLPSSNGMGWITLHLDRIAYSSRFGGSVELLFITDRNAGVELRKDALAWDMNGLQLRIYVSPTTSGLSHPSTAQSQGTVWGELSAKEAIAYQLTMQGGATSLRALPEAHEAELNSALQEIAVTVAAQTAAYARRFVYGFLWSQFKDLTGLDMIAERIYISDNEIDLVTRKGIPVVSVAYRAADVCSYGSDLLTEPEHCLTLSSDHVYANQIVHGPRRTFYLDSNGDDTGWVNAGSWTLDEAKQLGEIVLYLSGVEVDFPDADDQFETVEAHMKLDLGQLEAAHAAQQYGLIERIRLQPGMSDFLRPDIFGCEWSIFFDLESTVTLGIR
jgi:hypothetical protein